MASPAPWMTCYHEAGHAVLGVALRLGVRSVEAYRGPQGVTRCSPTSYCRYWKSIPARDIIFSLAGHQSAVLALRRVNPSHARFDLADVRRWLRRCRRTPRSRRAYLQELEQLTHDLVEAHWPEIDAVARQLRRRGRLDRAQVLRCMR
jgi:hypothetical protein